MDEEITIDKFKELVIKDLEEFCKLYRENAEKDPELNPLKMGIGDWMDQWECNPDSAIF